MITVLVLESVEFEQKHQQTAAEFLVLRCRSHRDKGAALPPCC